MALPKQSEDFPGWYQAVVKGAELAEPSLVRGTMVIRPYGFAIWERIQAAVDRRIKETGHSNLYFPLFIPYKLLEREAEHVEGFAPEVAVVTHAGGEELEEPLVVRPTSETIIWATYARWIQSYRDLPLLYNQWANVVRWELRPRLFLRTTEFLWQEGHTAHETADEAMAEARLILDAVYRATAEGDLAMPVHLGRKSASERFAGAVETFTMEALMRDGRALQAGTSHYLGQNFARAYDVRFLGRDGREEYAYASSWGVSTRLVGGLIMAHGDDAGLRLPPALAPVQVVVVPIYRTDEEKSTVLEAVGSLAQALRDAAVRVQVDDREEHRPGYKFNEWELKGVPVRLEIGPRDLERSEVVLYRRDLRQKSPVPLEGLARHVPGLLDQIQAELFDQAAAFREERTFRPKTYDELQAFVKDPGGFVEALWCGSPECEDRVKADTRATIRLLPLDPVFPEGACIVCGKPATEWAVWAQAY
ncbi:MAG TPA: proline--tRNA ligase [Acidimicrobiia bacterium]|nr:proline--tRNA ligase [Acidimicrobiia bacterium]